MPARVLLAFLLLSTCCIRADVTLDDALALIKSKRILEARDVLQKLVVTEPTNASAWHELGLVWKARRDNTAYEEAVRCLEKAVELDPKNADYLADYGGTAMELADRTRSISAANKGRDAMEKALTLDPDNLDAREGLFQFYLQAPFFVGGSNSKAAAQLEEIRRRDPDRAVALEVLTKAKAKDYSAAFQLCENALGKSPDNYTALYQYGRTASVSGQNLDRGLECLKKALTIEPPHPASPTHSNIWYRIGEIERKRGNAAGARSAYASALKLDANNHQASAALGQLK